jgi:hypothetical protein
MMLFLSLSSVRERKGQGAQGRVQPKILWLYGQGPGKQESLGLVSGPRSAILKRNNWAAKGRQEMNKFDPNDEKQFKTYERMRTVLGEAWEAALEHLGCVERARLEVRWWLQKRDYEHSPLMG